MSNAASLQAVMCQPQLLLGFGQRVFPNPPSRIAARLKAKGTTVVKTQVTLLPINLVSCPGTPVRCPPPLPKFTWAAFCDLEICTTHAKTHTHLSAEKAIEGQDSPGSPSQDLFLRRSKPQGLRKASQLPCLLPQIGQCCDRCRDGFPTLARRVL